MWDMVYINAQDVKQQVLELLGDKRTVLCELERKMILKWEL